MFFPYNSFGLPIWGHSFHYHHVNRLLLDNLDWFIRSNRSQLHSQRRPGCDLNLPHNAERHRRRKIWAELKVQCRREESILAQLVANHNVVSFSCERGLSIGD